MISKMFVKVISNSRFTKTLFFAVLCLGLQNLVFLPQSCLAQGAPVTKTLKAKPGDWVRIPVPELTQIEKSSAVIGCYPENNGWEVLTKFDGSAILAIQSKDEKVFLFTIAGISTAAETKGKLIVLTILLDQTPDKPKPPGPNPKPDPNPGPDPKPVPDSPYTDTLKSVYMVSPDAVSLGKLVNIFSSLVAGVDDNSINSADKLRAVLVGAASKDLAEADLRTTRDAIAKILATDLPKTAPWDKSNASKVLGNLLAALKSL